MRLKIWVRIIMLEQAKFWCRCEPSQGSHQLDPTTLEPKNLFKQNEMDYPSMQRVPSIRTSRRNGRWRIKVENKWTMNCLESERFIGTREVI